jgi:hypothetical protein
MIKISTHNSKSHFVPAAESACIGLEKRDVIVFQQRNDLSRFEDDTCPRVQEYPWLLVHMRSLNDDKMTLHVVVRTSNSQRLMVVEARQPPRKIMISKLFIITVTRRRNESAQTSVLGFTTKTPQNALTTDVPLLPKAPVEETYFEAVRIEVPSYLEAFISKHIEVLALEVDARILQSP